MPELPEVETIARTLNSLLANRRIKEVHLFREKNLLTSPSIFLSSLQGDSIAKVERKGKFLLFRLSSNRTILSHLPMEGKYYLYDTPAKKGKYDILSYDLDNGKTL
ncbi:MAG: DNA-formamidopyrimidine glycosylase, partial [Bacilli bacterium]|nr:DNA-formamidopyrimidine glycosylase [Bacilli bacterium]